MKARKVSITELLIKGLLLFSILTVLQGFSYLEDINKIAIAVLMVTMLLYLATCRYTVAQFLALFTTAILHIFALYYTEFPLYHFNMLFYFFLWVLLYFFFSKRKEKVQLELRMADNYINSVLWIWTIIVGISALLPSSYSGSYFRSFTGSSFRLMPTTLIIAALAMYMAISRKDNRYNWFLLLPTYAAFMNESRTYFGIYVLFLVMYLYMLFRKARYFYAMLGPVIVLIFIAMLNAGIMDKFIATQYTDESYFDYWGTITSSRTVFWAADLEAFFDLPFLQQFVGNGFNFVYDINLQAVNNEIWAHNDIINIMMNFGYIGVAIYLWAFYQLIKVFWPRGNRIPHLVKWLFILAVFINSMMNMSYTYLCAAISYPLFLYVMAERYEQESTS